jgi:hypothetical protein
MSEEELIESIPARRWGELTKQVNPPDEQ